MFMVYPFFFIDNGLPIDATENRGLVDIIKVNFFLVWLRVDLACPVDYAYLDPSPSS